MTVLHVRSNRSRRQLNERILGSLTALLFHGFKDIAIERRINPTFERVKRTEYAVDIEEYV